MQKIKEIKLKKLKTRTNIAGLVLIGLTNQVLSPIIMTYVMIKNKDKFHSVNVKKVLKAYAMPSFVIADCIKEEKHKIKILNLEQEYITKANKKEAAAKKKETKELKESGVSDLLRFIKQTTKDVKLVGETNLPIYGWQCHGTECSTLLTKEYEKFEIILNRAGNRVELYVIDDILICIINNRNSFVFKIKDSLRPINIGNIEKILKIPDSQVDVVKWAIEEKQDEIKIKKHEAEIMNFKRIIKDKINNKQKSGM